MPHLALAPPEDALCLGEKELDLCQLVFLRRRPKADA